MDENSLKVNRGASTVEGNNLISVDSCWQGPLYCVGRTVRAMVTLTLINADDLRFPA